MSLPSHLLNRDRRLFFLNQNNSPSASLQADPPSTSGNPHTSTMKNAKSPQSSSPPPTSIVTHSTSIKIELFSYPYPTILITTNSAHTVTLFLQPHHSPRLDGNIALSFALVNGRSILNEFDRLKSPAASLNSEIISIIESFLADDTLNCVTSLAGYQSFSGTRNDRREGNCLVHVRHCPSISVVTSRTDPRTDMAHYQGVDLCYPDYLYPLPFSS